MHFLRSDIAQQSDHSPSAWKLRDVETVYQLQYGRRPLPPPKRGDIQRATDLNTYPPLKKLSDSLGLRNEDRFETYHLANVPSTSIAALQIYPLTDLTDAGSLTVLFNSDWSLQAYSSKGETWGNVAPRENYAIINVGDGLKFMSGFKLKSSLHRVVPWHRRAASGPRYAAIFFLRPNNDAKLVDGEGVEGIAAEWLARKFQNYRIPHSEQKMNAISAGRKGFTGLLEATPESTSVGEML